MANAIQSVVGGYATAEYRSWTVVDAKGRSWKVVPDGSLTGGELSGEIVSPILKYEDIEELQQVVRAVRQAGAKADPQCCGVHVHVSAPNLDAAAVTRLAKMFAKHEVLLQHALGIDPGRLARYCRPVDTNFLRRIETARPRTMEALSEAWFGYRNTSPQRYDCSRYRMLNLVSLWIR